MSGRKWLVPVLVTTAVLFSCQKDKVELPESNDPVFQAEGVLGGESFKIVAGDNGAYMYTMTLEDNGVSVFTGRISDENFSLEMGIYDGNLDQPGHVPVEELTAASPRFANGTPGELIRLSKNMLMSLTQSQMIEKIDWYVNDVWVGENEATINEPGRYKVCGHIFFEGGVDEMLCNDVLVGYEIGANCMIDFSVGQQGALEASVNGLGDNVSSVNWYVDSVFVSSEMSLQTSLDPSFHIVTAEVLFENGVRRTKSVLAHGLYSLRGANDFTIFEYQAPALLPRDYNIRLLIEKDGKKYSSMLAENKNSTITVLDIEYYGKNDQGNDVYKVTAIVSATVRETTTLKTMPVSFTTQFGVEIK